MQTSDRRTATTGQDRSGRSRRPDTPSVHFGPGHPLAGLVAGQCRAAGHHPPSWRRGCGPCWERAIRADERFVIEFDLSRGLTAAPSPTEVDEVAVDRACAGQRVRLTGAELSVAVARLSARGLTCEQIARRLWRGHFVVRRVLARLAEGAAA